jgi:hypothetical protein
MPGNNRAILSHLRCIIPQLHSVLLVDRTRGEPQAKHGTKDLLAYRATISLAIPPPKCHALESLLALFIKLPFITYLRLSRLYLRLSTYCIPSRHTLCFHSTHWPDSETCYQNPTPRIKKPQTRFLLQTQFFPKTTKQARYSVAVSAAQWELSLGV